MATITPERDELTFGRVSSESLRDAAGAEYSDHEDIVRYLADEHPDVGWSWRQSITLGYAHARHPRPY